MQIVQKMLLGMIMCLFIGCQSNEPRPLPLQVSHKIGWIEDRLRGQKFLVIRFESSHGKIKEVRFQKLIISGINNRPLQMKVEDFSFSSQGDALEARSKQVFSPSAWKVSSHLIDAHAQIGYQWYPIY